MTKAGAKRRRLMPDAFCKACSVGHRWCPGGARAAHRGISAWVSADPGVPRRGVAIMRTVPAQRVEKSARRAGREVGGAALEALGQRVAAAGALDRGLGAEELDGEGRLRAQQHDERDVVEPRQIRAADPERGPHLIELALGLVDPLAAREIEDARDRGGHPLDQALDVVALLHATTIAARAGEQAILRG